MRQTIFRVGGQVLTLIFQTGTFLNRSINALHPTGVGGRKE